MNRITSEIFENYKINFDKLLKYGFAFDGTKYTFTTYILGNQMRLDISIDTKGDIQTVVFDTDSNEVYTLFLVEEASGVFVGDVRKEYEKVLCDVRDKCTDKTIFTTDYSHKLIEYIEQKYGDKLEFLWEKTPTNAIWRRKDNQKWYCAILKVKAKVLGLNGENFVEVIDFRESPEVIKEILEEKNSDSNYYPAYHMNKKYWLTIMLTDCTLPIQQIFKHIDNSYILAKKK